MPKINDLSNRPGGPQPTDEFWLASAGAAADFKTNFNALTAAVAGNITISQLNELLKREIAITVSNSAEVDNLPGRLPITGTVASTGRFTLTCPTGYVWHTAVGSGNNSTELRSITTNGVGTRELNVSVFNQNGSLQTVSFYLVGTLRDA